jgi:hypothetical protein
MPIWRKTRSLVYPLIVGALVVGCLGSRDEVSRVPAPSGDVDGVVVETNGGATTSFGYDVYVAPKGRSAFRGTKVARLYGALRNERAYGVNLRWTDAKTLTIEFLEARFVALEGRPPINVAGSSIAVVLARGINDPKACPGGMLYDLQMSKLRGPDCTLTRR